MTASMLCIYCLPPCPSPKTARKSWYSDAIREKTPPPERYITSFSIFPVSSPFSRGCHMQCGAGLGSDLEHGLEHVLVMNHRRQRVANYVLLGWAAKRLHKPWPCRSQGSFSAPSLSPPVKVGRTLASS